MMSLEMERGIDERVTNAYKIHWRSRAMHDASQYHFILPFREMPSHFVLLA